MLPGLDRGGMIPAMVYAGRLFPLFGDRRRLPDRGRSGGGARPPRWSASPLQRAGRRGAPHAPRPRLTRVRNRYALLAAADAVLAATGLPRARRFTEPLLMPSLAPRRGAPTGTALLLGGVGDVALLGSGPASFTAGLSAFLAGHVAWVAALRRRPTTHLLRRRPAAALPYAALLVGANALLWRRAGRDRLPVLVYSTALTATALAALDTGDLRTAAGGGLFLVSDGLLAAERFAGVHLPAHEGLVMATYTSAQALLASRG